MQRLLVLLTLVGWAACAPAEAAAGLVRGKAFERFITIWLENQVGNYLLIGLELGFTSPITITTTITITTITTTTTPDPNANESLYANPKADWPPRTSPRSPSTAASPTSRGRASC
jgi:hypothetical protein